MDKACSFVIATGCCGGVAKIPCAVRGWRRPFQRWLNSVISERVICAPDREAKQQGSVAALQPGSRHGRRMPPARRIWVPRLLRQKQIKVTQPAIFQPLPGLKEWRDPGRSSALVHLPLAIQNLEIRIRNFQIRGNRDE